MYFIIHNPHKDISSLCFFWCSYKHYFKNYNFKLFLLDYGNSIDYFMLRLYSAALPNSLFSSVFFFFSSASLGFSTHVTILPTHKQFYSFFSSLYTPPPPFPALMQWFRHPKKCWSGESRHPCLVLYLREKVFSLSPLRMTLTARLLWETFCQIEAASLLFQVCWARLWGISIGNCQVPFLLLLRYLYAVSP